MSLAWARAPDLAARRAAAAEFAGLVERFVRESETVRVFDQQIDKENDAGRSAMVTMALGSDLPGSRQHLREVGLLPDSDWGLLVGARWLREPEIVLKRGTTVLVAVDALRRAGARIQISGNTVTLHASGRVARLSARTTPPGVHRDVRGSFFVPISMLENQKLYTADVSEAGQVVWLTEERH